MKKGYTLIELLAVLALLASILTLVAINAFYFSDKRKNKDYENIKALIIDNAKVLVNTDKKISKTIDYNLQSLQTNDEDEVSCIFSYDKLVDYDLMDEDTKNPVTNELLYKSNKWIKIDLKDLEYSYEYIEDLGEETYPDCLTPIPQE